MEFRGVQDSWLVGEGKLFTRRLGIRQWVRKMVGAQRRETIRALKAKKTRGGSMADRHRKYRMLTRRSAEPLVKWLEKEGKGLVPHRNMKSMRPGVGFCWVQVRESNTVATLIDGSGRTVGVVSGGQSGFIGKTRRSPKAILSSARKLGMKGRAAGLWGCHLMVVSEGDTSGSRGVISGLKRGGLAALSVSLRDRTQFGGCRRKSRPSK